MTDRSLSGAQAIGEALFQAMERDANVIVVGEDISGGAGLGEPYEGEMGGSFGVTRSLFSAFGPTRVRDTPISEAAVAGLAAGAAAAGILALI